MNREASILLWIQNYFRKDRWTAFWKKITALCNFGWFWIAVILLCLSLRQTRTQGVLAAVALGISSFIANVILKPLVRRPRPYDAQEELIPLLPPQKDLAFPSGHTCASFTCAFIYLWFFPLYIGIPMIILASLIAFSRIYLGVHYPSDVLAGILIALGTDIVVVRLAPAMFWMIFKKPV